MRRFELRERQDGFLLSGGQLEKPLLYRDKDPEAAIRLVGFLSQQCGSTLEIHGKGGVVRTQHRESVKPLQQGSIGDALRGNASLGAAS